MAKLNDLHLTLLTRAAQRDSGSLHPLPQVRSGATRVAAAIKTLVEQGLAEECETSVPEEVARTDGDLRFGMYVTAPGLSAIGLGDADPVAPPSPAAAVADAGEQASPARTTKTSTVLALLGRAEGATLTEMVEATGWLPHTTRAALTGLRKKNHAVERDDATCYRIAAVAAA